MISRFEQEIREKTLSGKDSGKEPRLWERRVPPRDEFYPKTAPWQFPSHFVAS
jgi:hypothetical protein